MKIKNVVALLCLLALIIAVLTVSALKNSDIKGSVQKNETFSALSQQSDTSQIPSYAASSLNATSNENRNPSSSADNVFVSMTDSLFIGDSRTVGLMEYAEISNADFFCNVGMSVYNIDKKTVSVPNVGKVTLTELLTHKKYGKIYIMLGVNEVGYQINKTVSKYSGLIDLIRQSQPDAVVFIQANLHVTKQRSEGDKVVNNSAIDKLNTQLKTLADGKSVFYLDANTVFDDGSGNLPSDKSEDGTHLYAKYYAEWGRWIINQTSSPSGKG